MNIFVFSDKETALKKVFPNTAVFFPIAALSEHSPKDESVSYLDISGLNDADLKKTLTKLKKVCADACWGIVDPKGSVKDTAELFFEGASDYIGTTAVKNVDLKRIKKAAQWRKEILKSADSKNAKASTGKEQEGAMFLNNGIKLPSSSVFPGWKKIQSGDTIPFYLLYCSLQGKIPIDSRFDEKTSNQIHKKFLASLEDNFFDSEGLLWMNSGKDCLLLIPPSAKCAEEAVKTCIKMLVSAPLITMEILNLNIPANFIFALHYGSINYKPPGRTGTVISDAVNFTFHLGAKKSEPGRLTISGELPEKTISKTLQDCFISAGEFEGRKIWQTKKFSYVKPWM